MLSLTDVKIRAVKDKETGVVNLLVEGNLLYSNAKLLEDKLEKLVGQDVVIDFSKTGLITSKGLAILIDFLKKQETLNKKVKIKVGTSYVKRVLEMAGLVDKVDVI